MAKSIDRVADKYELKLRNGRVPTRADGDVKRQVEQFKMGMERAEVMRVMMAQELCSRGVCTIWWPYYYDFGRKLAGLKRRVSPAETLLVEARMQLEVWVARGLDRAVLEAIACNCFELNLSGPQPTLAREPAPT